MTTLASDSTVGTLTLADGSITDSNGSISFGDENLSTTGTLSAGNTTVAGTLNVSGNTTLGVSLVKINSEKVEIDASSTTNGIKIGTNATHDTPITFGHSTNQTATFQCNLTQSSDQRLKNTITNLSGALDSLAQINAVRYKWNHSGKDDIGLIAQNVEPVFPEMVSTDEEGMKSVAYSKMVSVLIAAVQEQQDMINELKSQVAYLSNLN